MWTTDIEELHILAIRQDNGTIQRAEIALRECYRVLMESGQLEVNPPRALVNFFAPRSPDADES